MFLSEMVVKCSDPYNKKLKDIGSLFSLKDEVTSKIWLPVHDGAGTAAGSITGFYVVTCWPQPVSAQNNVQLELSNLAFH